MQPEFRCDADMVGANDFTPTWMCTKIQLKCIQRNF